MRESRLSPLDVHKLRSFSQVITGLYWLITVTFSPNYNKKENPEKYRKWFLMIDFECFICLT